MSSCIAAIDEAIPVARPHGRGGKGKLVIHYTDLDTLEGVLERLRSRQHG